MHNSSIIKSMDKLLKEEPRIEIYNHDLSNEFLKIIRKSKIVAWDIETSSLDWRNGRIGICQLYVPAKQVVIVKIDASPPKNLISILSDHSVKKVFHHAMFDLRFMCYHWEVLPQNVACTKIAAKLLNIERDNNQSLRSALNKYLDVDIDKNERLSNWMVKDLTKKQIFYAVRDVIYLIPLLKSLEKQLKSKGYLEIARSCFKFMPTRVQLEILGFEDIYRY